jgi:UDP-galactopyranose mutase
MIHPQRYLVVGAGFSGAVLAREIADHTDAKILVVDERPHIAGNCYTERDETSGVTLHKYGPHIFNTDYENVWDYMNCHGRMRPFINRVKASTSRGVFSMPINLMTINQFFGKAFNPKEARAFVATLGDSSIKEPANFEEQALKFVGRDLYKTFFYGYTKKQWGCEPTELSAAILKRLPIRFNYDDNYYSSTYQGIPEEGYTQIVQNILDHPQIEVQLGRSFTRDEGKEFIHVFYTGPIDAYFGYHLGRLKYRTVTFERIDGVDDLLGNAVMNHPELSVPFTRVHEHKHFTPWEKHDKTVAFQEYSKATEPQDTPYYPVRHSDDKLLLEKYYDLARQEANVSYLGRLATYRYLDMDDVIHEALDFAAAFLRETHGRPSADLAAGRQAAPRFSFDPFAETIAAG